MGSYVEKIETVRSYTILYADSNRAPQVSDDAVTNVRNGPDIVAIGPDGQTVIVEVKGSASADGNLASRSDIDGPLEDAATFSQDPNLLEAVRRLELITPNSGSYDSIMSAASTQSRFSGTLEDVLDSLTRDG